MTANRRLCVAITLRWPSEARLLLLYDFAEIMTVRCGTALEKLGVTTALVEEHASLLARVSMHHFWPESAYKQSGLLMGSTC
jgi:hypothetical protein